jgi:hypothetical protein
MSIESEHKSTIMTAAHLLEALADSGVQDDFEIWLSSDEKGNDFLPISANPELSLAIDASNKRVVLFPSHR